MKTVMIPAESSEVNSLLDQAREEDLIVRAADGAEFVVAPVDDFGHEVALTRANEKIMALLDERGRQTRTIPLEKAKRQLGLTN